MDVCPKCQDSCRGSPRPIKDFITEDEYGVNWIKIGEVENIEKYIYKTKRQNNSANGNQKIKINQEVHNRKSIGLK